MGMRRRRSAAVGGGGAARRLEQAFLGTRPGIPWGAAWELGEKKPCSVASRGPERRRSQRQGIRRQAGSSHEEGFRRRSFHRFDWTNSYVNLRRLWHTPALNGTKTGWKDIRL